MVRLRAIATDLPARHTPGEVVNVDQIFEVTVNKVTTSPGTQFFRPYKDNYFLLVNVSIKNISSENQTIMSLKNFVLKDSTGQDADRGYLPEADSPDGSLLPGDVLRGTLVYEVRAGEKTFILTFQNGNTGSHTRWDVSTLDINRSIGYAFSISNDISYYIECTCPNITKLQNDQQTT